MDDFRRRPTMEGFSRPGSLGGEAVNDDEVEGHIMSDDFRPEDGDTEGHATRPRISDDDTEGHATRPRLSDDDTEGHATRPRVNDDEDTEGHANRPRVNDDDDTEGHRQIR